MKEIKIIAILLFTALFFASCDEWFEFELPEEGTIVDENGPQASFSVLQKDETDWKTVTFTNLSTEALYYEWRLGDGTVVNTSELEEDEASFTHTYDTDVETDYTITLIASDDGDNSSTEEIVYSLREILSSSFEVEQNVSDVASITLINNSAGADSYLWNFGDGTTSTEFEPSHTYTSGLNSYLITLTTTRGTQEETSTFVYKAYLIPEILEGDFELGDEDDYRDGDNNPVDDPVGDSRDVWQSPYRRVTGQSVTIQISNDGLDGEFAGKLPRIEDDGDYRCGYQRIVITPYTNYRITYKYSIENDDSTQNGTLHVGVVQPMSSWSQLDANTIAMNVHEETGAGTGTVSASVEFNSGASSIVAVIFFNLVEEARIDSIVLEGLD